MKRLAGGFFVQHRGGLEYLIPTMIPACLTEVCRELKAKCIMPSCSETPRGVRPSKPTLIHLGDVLRTIYTAAGSPAPVLSPPPESELKGHKRKKKKKKCCTQRFRKCLFTHGKPSRQQNVRLNILKECNSSSAYCRCKTKQRS